MRPPILFLVFLSFFTCATLAAFKHPGIGVSRAHLDFVKAQLVAKAQPWTLALSQAQRSRLGQPIYTPKPWKVVECGPFSKPNYGCSDETRDAAAAYLQAMLYHFTGNISYMHNSIKILNAWSILTAHTNANAPLQAAWTGAMWAKAAELARYLSPPGLWSSASIARFISMLHRAHLPRIINGWNNGAGNWDLAMADAVINIGIFTDDVATFNKGIALWRLRVPSYIYMKTDGVLPKYPPRNYIRTRSGLLSFWFDSTGIFVGIFFGNKG